MSPLLVLAIILGSCAITIGLLVVLRRRQPTGWWVDPGRAAGVLGAARSPFAGKGIDLCNDGDPICSPGRNPFAHTNYETSDAVGRAAGFIAGRL